MVTFGYIERSSSPCCKPDLGAAPADLRECEFQFVLVDEYANTPKPEWNPDTPKEHDFYEDWERVSNNREFENAFKIQWARCIRHVLADEPFPWDFAAGVRGVQLTEASYQSSDEGRRVAIDELEI